MRLGELPRGDEDRSKRASDGHVAALLAALAEERKKTAAAGLALAEERKKSAAALLAEKDAELAEKDAQLTKLLENLKVFADEKEARTVDFLEKNVGSLNLDPPTDSSVTVQQVWDGRPRLLKEQLKPTLREPIGTSNLSPQQT